MSFRNPEFFLLLLPLIFAFIKILRQKPPAIRYSLGDFLGERKLRRKFFELTPVIAAVFLVIALARPVKGIKEKTVTKEGIDIMLVMDVSTSMQALDFKPKNRMEAAQAAAKKFVENRPSDRIGIVVFAGLPLLHCPLTLDHSAVINLIEAMKPGMVESDGTAIGLGISLGLKYLERSSSKRKIMILLTDGANNKGEITPAVAAELAAKLGVKIYTIGCGSPGEALVPVDHPFFGRQLVKIQDELDEKTLKMIADVTSGKYFRASNFSKMEQIYSEINKMEKTEISTTEFYEFEEKFRIPLAFGILLIVVNFLAKTFSRGIIP